MKLTVASSPHIRGDFKTSRLMLDVVIALLPALLAGTVVFGFRALALTVVSMLAAVAAEGLFALVTRQRSTIRDCSALVTGMLVALILPVTVPYWLVVFGSAFAIIVIKLMWGGLGQNVFNPALSARAFVMLLWPAYVTRYPGLDGVTAATPLHHMVMPALPTESVLDMFLGNCPGSIGEISSLALLIGGAYLIYRKVITVRIPASYLLTVAAVTFVFHKTDNALSWMLYSLFSGGVMLGAIFMATEYGSSPVTPLGQVIFGIGCGILTVIFRYFGLFPEGVTYAILLMNGLVWAIDRIPPPRRFGMKRGGRNNA